MLVRPAVPLIQLNYLHGFDALRRFVTFPSPPCPEWDRGARTLTRTGCREWLESCHLERSRREDNIKMHFLKSGSEMVGVRSGSCPVADTGISGSLSCSHDPAPAAVSSFVSSR
jgi:hypothetical protein